MTDIRGKMDTSEREWLVSRWQKDLKFKNLKDRIREDAIKQMYAFADLNRDRMPRYQIISAYEPDMYEGYLEFVPNYERLLGRCELEHEKYYDLRGYNNSNHCFMGFHFQKVMFAYMVELMQGGFTLSKFNNCRFYKIVLGPYSNLGHYHKKSVIEESDLNRSSFMFVMFIDSHIKYCKLTKLKGWSTILKDVKIEKCDFRDTYLGASYYQRVLFKDCTFRGGSFSQDSHYDDVEFIECDFRNVRSDEMPPAHTIIN